MNLKALWENKLFRMLTIVIAVIIVIIVAIVVVMAMSGGRASSFNQLEDKLVAAAKDYYSANPDKLPATISEKAEIDSTTLSAEKYMKSMDKLQPKGSSCTGRVVVKNVNQGYFYQAFISCGEDYNTTTLSSHIMTKENVVTIGDGLYNINGAHVYRGEEPNNYVSFAGRLYRIVEINPDGTINIIATEKGERVVWDDRFNQDRNNEDGINDFTISRIKDSLLTVANSDLFNDNDRNKLEFQTLCIGKVSETDVLTFKTECSVPLENQIVGLLPASYYVNASLDANCKTILDGTCQNYNYLQTNYNWWTLTADSQKSHRVFAVQASSNGYVARASANASIRETLKLTENVVYKSGTGTLDDPYIIK